MNVETLHALGELRVAEHRTEVSPTDLEPLAGGNLIEHGDRRLLGSPAQRESDQQRHGDRIDDQYRRRQGRSREDAEVLQEQPAGAPHQWPRWRRKETKALSKSAPSPPSAATSRSRALGVPLKSSSPSASTTTLVA